MSAQPIIVSVETEYLSRQSQPEESRYAFAYHITIENCGSAPAQLLSRHWVIVDANQERKEIKGMGLLVSSP